jgi:hypothetical protein
MTVGTVLSSSGVLVLEVLRCNKLTAFFHPIHMNLCVNILCSRFGRVRKIAKSDFYLRYFVSVIS